jgi:protein-S-isoprenylcysteine O-methyltransferase Ste14
MHPPRHPEPTTNRPWHGRRGEWLVVLQILLAGTFVLFPPWNPWTTPELLASTGIARAAALCVLGGTASVMAALALTKIGRYLTPLPHPVAHSELVTSGIYGWVRHPLYSCQLIAGLGWSLYTLSAVHLGLLLAGFLFFDYKAKVEERWLTERHPAYRAYARRVRKLLPWLY